MTTHPMPTRRRTVSALILTAVVALATLACGTPAGTGGATTSPSGAFTPVSIAGPYGPQQLTTSAHRVVALSADWLGTMIAAGAHIVGYRTDGPAVAMPTPSWLARSIPTDAVSFTGTLNVERIAAVHPDVIVGPSWLITRDVFRTLSAIAPTIVDSDSPAGTEFGSWQRQLRDAGTILGTSTDATEKALINRIRASAARHPQTPGKKFSIAVVVGTQLATVNSADTSAVRLLSAYGMTPLHIPGPTTNGRTVVSRENLSQLDAAYLVVIGSNEAAADTVKLFVGTRPRTSSTLVLDLATLNAFNVPDASSVPVILNELDRALGAR